MTTGADERGDNESYKFGGTAPSNIYVKTGLTDSSGNSISSSNPLPVSNGPGTSTDLEGGGKISIGTTAIEVTFTGTTEAIIISADTDNTGTLYVGKSDVASDGSNAITFLEAGESLEMDYEDSSNAIYIVASVISQNFWKGALK